MKECIFFMTRDKSGNVVEPAGDRGFCLIKTKCDKRCRFFVNRMNMKSEGDKDE